VSERDDRVQRLLADHPCETANEVALVMLEQLDRALHGETWARPEPSRQVWDALLAEVRAHREA
jgi:hypothetical protein